MQSDLFKNPAPTPFVPEIDPQLEPSWKQALAEEFSKPYFAAIKTGLVQALNAGKTVYPPGPLIFNAFNRTALENVRVVILGQDPYHGAGQAHGLCFSVQTGVKPPPSLVNIYKELASDVGFQIPAHGNLEPWADRGVFLLNAILTVEGGSAASHRDLGWEHFTDAVIHAISEQREGVVFLLWGKFAHEKEYLIDPVKHYILKAAHPSPFSAHSGFFGCKHFSRTNELLEARGEAPIDWTL
jgi:uracil-DNA glycosylase